MSKNLVIMQPYVDDNTEWNLHSTSAKVISTSPGEFSPIITTGPDLI